MERSPTGKRLLRFHLSKRKDFWQLSNVFDIFKLARSFLFTKEELQRNRLGTAFKFNHVTQLCEPYPSSLPSHFPGSVIKLKIDIQQCFCKPEVYQLSSVGPITQVNQLCRNVLLGSELLPGFCSLATIPFTATLGYHGVTVFGSESK